MQNKKAVTVDKYSMFLQVNIAVISSGSFLCHYGILTYMCKQNFIFPQISDVWANLPPNLKQHLTLKQNKSKLNDRYV